MKQGLIIGIIVIGIIVAAVNFGGTDSVVAEPSEHFYGVKDSSVVLVEYGDFECPACGSFAPMVAQIKEEFKDKIRFEFVNYPLVQIHVNAIAAHRAAEAAHVQGKFWEMHDLLYERQALWRNQSSSNPVPLFEQYAEELGLDVGKFKEDVAKSETLAIINADIAEGKSLNVDSTPTFFLNGKKIEDVSSISTIENFRATIQAAVDEAEKSNTNTENSDPASGL